MVLEGLGRNLDPSLDVLAAAAPVLAAQAVKSRFERAAGTTTGTASCSQW